MKTPWEVPSVFEVQGDTDFQVNLVVLGLDGKPKPNALWMDAVSLNFKD